MIVEPDVEPELTVIADSAVESVFIANQETVGVTVESREIGLTLGNLVDPTRKLVSVASTATIKEAVTKMLLNDFSQLPVVDKRKLVGAVTWQSIARAWAKDPDATFAAVIVKATELPFGHDLNDVLPRLQSEDFVVVRSAQNEITGIVTTADVVKLYGERTLPFLLIGELDQELRKVIADAIDLEDIQKVCADFGVPKLISHDDMTMGHYQRVLENPDCWQKLGWSLDRVAFVHRLHELREIRNDIMHFNPDGVPAGTVVMLNHMLNVIRRFGSSESG